MTTTTEFSIGNPPVMRLDLQSNTKYQAIKKSNTTLYDRFVNMFNAVDNPVVCLSGGYDSQFNLMMLLEMGIPFKIVSYRTLWGANVVNASDVEFSKNIASRLKLGNIEVIDIDLQDFLENNKYIDVAKQYATSSPQIALHLHFADMLQNYGTPIFGDDLIYMYFGNRTAGTNVYNVTANMAGLTQEPIGYFRTHNGFINFENSGKKIFKNKFLADPETYYLSLKQNIEVTNRHSVYFGAFLSSLTSPEYKKLYYDSILQDLKLFDNFGKLTGFETLQAHLASKTGQHNYFDQLYRYPLQQNDNLFTQISLKGMVPYNNNNSTYDKEWTQIKEVKKGPFKELFDEYHEAINNTKATPMFSYRSL